MCICVKIEERPNMKQLLRILREEPIATKWYELGLELLDNSSHLQVIKADNQNSVQSCCQGMFQRWLDVKHDASWSELVTALRSIEMTTAADTISKRHVTGRRSYSYTHIL